jgi:hypothetical protein
MRVPGISENLKTGKLFLDEKGIRLGSLNGC